VVGAHCAGPAAQHSRCSWCQCESRQQAVFNTGVDSSKACPAKVAAIRLRSFDTHPAHHRAVGQPDERVGGPAAPLSTRLQREEADAGQRALAVQQLQQQGERMGVWCQSLAAASGTRLHALANVYSGKGAWPSTSAPQVAWRVGCQCLWRGGRQQPPIGSGCRTAPSWPAQGTRPACINNGVIAATSGGQQQGCGEWAASAYGGAAASSHPLGLVVVQHRVGQRRARGLHASTTV
jgi:hypothetical protein